MNTPFLEPISSVSGLGARADTVISDLQTYLSQPDASSPLALIGQSDWASEIDHWAKAHYPGPYLGHFRDRTPFNEEPGSFTDLALALKDRGTPSTLVVCTPPERYLPLTRRLFPQYAWNGTWVLPFLPDTNWPTSQLDPYRPIVVHSVSRSGTLRFWPTFSTLLKALGRQIKHLPEPHLNARYMARSRSNPLEKKTNNLLDELQNWMQTDDLRFPDESECLDFFRSALNHVDFYEAHLLHAHVFVPLSPLVEAAPDIQWVALMRDPRDLLVSFYFAFVHMAYFIRSQASPSAEWGFPHRLKEDLLMRLIEQGWRYQSFHKLIACPSITQLTQHYLACIQDPRVQVVRFEELHTQETYTRLLSLQGLLDSPYYTLSEPLWEAAWKAGSFSAQTQGKRQRGDPMEQPERNYGSHRRGIVGDWKNHLTLAHKHRIKTLIGEELVALGYEKDLAW